MQGTLKRATVSERENVSPDIPCDECRKDETGAGE